MPAVIGKVQVKTSFKASQTIDSVYTGGKVAITSDEQWLVTSLGEDLIITDIASGKQLQRLKGDSEVVTTFAITPDKRFLVSASRSLTLRIWDLNTFSVLRSFRAHDAPVIMMDIDPTSTLVATGSADSSIKVWDIERGFCTHNFRGHGGVVSAVKFHHDPKHLLLATGADDAQVRVWDLHSRGCIAVLESHVSVIRGLDFTADGWHLISGSRDKVVNVWDLKKKTLLRTFPIYETLETVGLLNSRTVIGDFQDMDGSNIFYTGGDKGILRLWDLTTGELVKEQVAEKNSTHAITDVIYTPKSQWLSAVTSDQNILIYDINSNLQRIKQVVGFNDEIVDLAYIGEEENHLAVATNSNQIRVFDLRNYDCDIVYGHSDIVICLDKSKDGRLLVSGSKDNNARIWAVNVNAADAQDRYRCVGVCVGHTEAVGAIAISRKAASFVITGSQDRTIKCWDLSKVDFTVADENTKPKSLFTFQAHDKDINSIAVAPNDRLFATGSQDKTAKIWSVETGKLIGTCNGHKRGVWSVQFSPVDQVLATSSGDKTIKIWSLTDMSCLKTFEGHTNSILKVHFLTAGMQLISSGSDGLVKLWTIKTNECVGTFDNHTEKIWGLAVRKDEKFVVSGGADSLINFWEDVTEEEHERAVREKEDLIAKQQDLSNFLLKKDYRNAILLAMSLNQPLRLYGLFDDVIDNRPAGDNSITGSATIDDILKSFTKEQIGTLLEYVRDWNTNAKRSRTAQTVLYAILSSFSPDDLAEIPNCKEIIDGLLPYTERHYQRIEDLLTQSFIVDYTLQAMDATNHVPEVDMQANGNAHEN